MDPTSLWLRVYLHAFPQVQRGDTDYGTANKRVAAKVGFSR